MENKLSLTKNLSDLRMKAARLYNESVTDESKKEAFSESLVEINSLKAKIANLKDRG